MKRISFLSLALACLFSHSGLTQPVAQKQEQSVALEQADMPPDANSEPAAGNAVQRVAVGAPQAKSVREFLAPDGRFDLEAARRSGYQGPLDMEGFTTARDRVTGDLSFQRSATRGTASDRDDVYWDNSISPSVVPGVDGPVYALTVYDSTLIAGGEFTTAGGVAANYVAAWDGLAWSPLGSGMDFPSFFPVVYALAAYDGKLIAGGTFTRAGGVAANYIASWDGSAWSPLGSGLLGGASALAVYDGKLIAGGLFTKAGAVFANRIAAWDDTAWSRLTFGMVSHVRALVVYDGKLIAGGDFDTLAGGIANYIASWDGSTWSPLGTGMNAWVFALAVYDGKLIAGGIFYLGGQGGGIANYIASWDGSAWSPLGSEVNHGVNALAVYAGKLIAGGWITMAGEGAVNYIASWDGSAWSPLGSGVDTVVRSLTVYDGKLFAGGDFTTAGGVPATHIAAWDGSSWSAVESEVCQVLMTGDVNQSSAITSADVITLVNYVFKGGLLPLPCAAAGDINCSGSVTSADVITLVNHVFKGGAPPCDVCTLIPGTWSCP